MLSIIRISLICLPVVWAGQVLSADLPLKVSPDVVEVEADDGDVVNAEVAFINAQDWPTPVRLEAVNWGYDEAGRRRYGEGLDVLEDCRNWWRAGSADLLIQPGGVLIHKLTLHVPDDVEEMECHFALAVIPVSGGERYSRRYIPVFVNVDGAEPELEFESLVMGKDAAGKKQPMVVVRNIGTARSKLYGMLEGEDAQGQDLDLVVRSTEVLAGESRAIPLIVSRQGGGEVWWSTPLEIDGDLIWDGGEIEVDGELQ